jgi:thiamine-phosphate pyrophosphorylase
LKPYRIILREKDLTESEYFTLTEKVLDICKKYDVQLCCHKFVNVALELGVKAIHLPMENLKNMTPKEKGFFQEIGASTHSVEQAVTAENLGATYITVSHIFPTKCKANLPPKGLDLIKDVKRNVAVPVYALGGINENNAELCIQAGADGVCIMSGFMEG